MKTVVAPNYTKYVPSKCFKLTEGAVPRPDLTRDGGNKLQLQTLSAYYRLGLNELQCKTS